MDLQSIKTELLLNRKKYTQIAILSLIISLLVASNNFQTEVGIFQGDRLTYELAAYEDHITGTTDYLLDDKYPLSPGQSFILRVDDINFKKTTVDYRVQIGDEWQGNLTEGIRGWGTWAQKTDDGLIRKSDVDHLAFVSPEILKALNLGFARINFSDNISDGKKITSRKNTFAFRNDDDQLIGFNFTYTSSTKKRIINSIEFTISDITDPENVSKLFTLSILNTGYSIIRNIYPFLFTFILTIILILAVINLYQRFLNSKGFSTFSEYRYAKSLGAGTKEILDRLDETGARNIDVLNEILGAGYKTRLDYKKSIRGKKKIDKRRNR